MWHSISMKTSTKWKGALGLNIQSHWNNKAASTSFKFEHDDVRKTAQDAIWKISTYVDVDWEAES